MVRSQCRTKGEFSCHLHVPALFSNISLKASLLTQSARIRASLFNFQLPLDFAATWLLERLFEQKPESLPVPVAPTREFCVALFMAKIEATIRNEGDIIGWEDDDNTVGPVAAAAKQSLLRLIPHMMPADSASLYRPILEHGDFGIHNMSITMDADGKPRVTSLYDWETGCIAPAILSDPLMAVSVDLVVDENGEPSITRVPSDEAPGDRAEYMEAATQYFEVRFFLYSTGNYSINKRSLLRFSSKKRPTTKVRSRPEKMRGISGLH